jgi:tetratricopeptide (TPR) repeat protein
MIHDPWSTVQEEVHLHPDFIQGQRYYRQGDLKSALLCFKAAHQSTDIAHVYAHLYMSYLGVTQVLLNDVSGLNLCRRAAQEEGHRGEVFENLARAELKLGHRKQACDALRRGMRLDKGNAGLRALREDMGVRRHPCLSFLDRDNPLNRLLGKITYRTRRVREAER